MALALQFPRSTKSHGASLDAFEFATRRSSAEPVLYWHERDIEQIICRAVPRGESTACYHDGENGYENIMVILGIELNASDLRAT